MTRINIVIAAGLALAVTLPVVSAQAQSIRTFVSTAGSDSNPCTITQPCRHFQAAVNATAVGGEVDALDAGAYGSFTISQAITIEGQGWSYIAPPTGGNGITINAVQRQRHATRRIAQWGRRHRQHQRNRLSERVPRGVTVNRELRCPKLDKYGSQFRTGRGSGALGVELIFY